jgi:hypothetical protein
MNNLQSVKKSTYFILNEKISWLMNPPETITKQNTKQYIYIK